MSRKTKTIIIPPAKPEDRFTRDCGKTYIITEMPASQAEWWATRAWIALSRSGVQYPPGLVQLGFVGVAFVLFQAMRLATPDEIKPLFEEMFACVKAAPNAADPTITRALIESDIEEIQTRINLRKEVLELHAGFTMAELASMLASSAMTSETERGSPTPTSPGSSPA